MNVWLYRILRPLLAVLLKILYRPTIIGKENIPSKGGIVLAGNHTSGLDPVLILASTKRTVHYLSKIELHRGLKKIIFKSVGTIPVDRSRHNPEALMKAKEVLSAGKVIGIFPESTINRTKDIILPFKIGSVKMAKDTNSYLIPFVITGRYKLFRKSVTIEFFKKRKITDDLDSENQKLMNFIRGQLEKRK